MPDAASPELPELDDAAYQRALAILIDVGVSIAQELKAPAKDASVTARAVAFKQVDEAVRRTIVLSRHIAENPPRRIDKRTATRRQIIRAVENNIHRHATPGDAASLRIELLDRIDAPDFIDDLDNRPPGELIAELCRDMGVVAATFGLPLPLRRTPADIAMLCAQAAAPAGSGFPQWLAATAAQAAENDKALPPKHAHPSSPSPAGGRGSG